MISFHMTNFIYSFVLATLFANFYHVSPSMFNLVQRTINQFCRCLFSYRYTIISHINVVMWEEQKMIEDILLV